VSDSRLLLRAAIGAYVVSFFLVAIGGPRTTGYGCAIAALMGPFIAIDAPSDTGEFFDGNPLGYPALFVSGLVNIAFPLALLFRLTRHRRAFVAARIAVLLMIPFSWLVFVLLPVLPREGHVLWVGGMLLALFSDEIAARRRTTTTVASGRPEGLHY